MVNYTPKTVKEDKQQKAKDILVKDIMLKVFTSFTEDMDINEAANILVKKNISGAPVINEDDKPVGFLSEKDCLKSEIEMKYYNDSARKVSDYMSRKITPVHPDSDIYKAIDLFTKHHFYCYPVVENKKVVGVIFRSSVLRAVCQMTQANWK